MPICEVTKIILRSHGFPGLRYKVRRHIVFCLKCIAHFSKENKRNGLKNRACIHKVYNKYDYVEGFCGYKDPYKIIKVIQHDKKCLWIWLRFR